LALRQPRESAIRRNFCLRAAVLIVVKMPFPLGSLELNSFRESAGVCQPIFISRDFLLEVLSRKK
jgi:hypothetical protein